MLQGRRCQCPEKTGLHVGARERGSHTWFVNEEERMVVSTDRASTDEFDQSSRIPFEILKAGDLLCDIGRRIEGFLYTETG